MGRYYAAGGIGVFLSTLSLRRATAGHKLFGQQPEISIHALLAESDRRMLLQAQAPRNFYPRSPCGERHGLQYIWGSAQRISIHALLAESDGSKTDNSKLVDLFLSTLSLRRATSDIQGDDTNKKISIHALLAESDQAMFLL